MVSPHSEATEAALVPLSPPLPPRYRSFFGAFLDTLRRPLDQLVDGAAALGPVYRMGRYPLEAYIVSGEPARQLMVQKDESNLTRAALFHAITHDIGVGIFGMFGREHEQLRQLVRLGYSRQVVAPFVPQIIARQQAALAHWPRRFRLREAASDLSQLGVMVAISPEPLGCPLRTVTDFAHAVMLDTVKLRPRAALYTPGHLWRKRRVHAAMAGLVSAHRAGKYADRPETWMIDAFIAAEVDGQRLDDDAIRGCALNAVGATPAYQGRVVTFMIYHLLQDPPLLAEVLEEVDSAFLDGTPNAEVLRRMTILRSVYLEALRRYPIIMAQPHQASRDLVVGGYRIPKGAILLITSTPDHFLSPGYRQPWTFDPARVREPRNEHRQGHAFNPWGIPPRTCPAAGLVELTTLATVVSILHEVELALTRSSQQFRVVQDPLIAPHDGVPVELVRRRRAIDRRAGRGVLAGRAATADDLAQEWLEGELPPLRPRMVRAGETVFAQGEPADAFYILLDGRAAVHREEQGAARAQGALEAGQSFGEQGLLKGGLRAATVRAETSLRLLQIDRPTFTRLVVNSDLTADEIGAVLQRDFVHASLRAAIPALSRQVLADLGDEFAVRAFEAGEIVFHRGDPADALYVVLHGAFEIVQEDEGPATFDPLGPGQVFGEMGILHRQPRSATVRAREPSLVGVIAEREVRRTLLADANAVGGLALTVSRRLMQRLSLWQGEAEQQPVQRTSATIRACPFRHDRGPGIDFDAVYHGVTAEISGRPAQVQGALPAALEGVVLRCGPGLFGVGSQPLSAAGAHGVVAALRLRRGQAVLDVRFPRTAVFEEERRSGRMRRRRAVDPLPGWWPGLVRRAPAHTASGDVFLWAGRVVATGLLHTALDPRTLGTIGEERWGGIARPGQQLCPSPAVDPVTGHLLGYVLSPGSRGPRRVQLFELDRSGALASSGAPLALPADTAAVHGLAFTQGWVLLSATDTGRRASILLLQRRDGAAVARVPVPSAAVLPWLANAFEEDGHVTLDAVALESPVDPAPFGPALYRRSRGLRYSDSGPPMLRRYRMDPRSLRLEEADLCPLSAWAPCVEPARLGRRHDRVFASLRAPGHVVPDAGAPVWYTGVGRVEPAGGLVDLWEAGPGRFVGPPAYAQDQQAAGWVLSWVLDSAARSSDLVVLRADALSAGPVATVRTGVLLPACAHMRWVPGAAAPDRED